MEHTSRPFVRSRHDRMLAGVMGGIARRFGWNSTLLRVVFVLVARVLVAAGLVSEYKPRRSSGRRSH